MLLAVLLTAPFLAQADATIANVATPTIRHSLGASGADVELVIGGYLIGFAVLLITGARLGQTHGYKRLFHCGLVVFGVASLVGGLAPNVTVLIIMRLLQGAGAALLFPQALTGIQLNFAGAARTRAIGAYALALSSGAVAGQILGGVLIASMGWRSILLINVPVCAVVIIAARRWLPADQPSGTARVDPLGVTTLSAALLLLVPPLILGREQGWPAWAWICLAASIPAIGLFLRTQRRAATPLITLEVLTRRPVSMALLAMTMATGTYYALLFTLAQYLQAGLGRSALAAGLILVPWVAAFGLAGQAVRRLPKRWNLPVAGYLLLCLAYLGIGAGLHFGHLPEPVMITLLALGGFGLGTAFVTLLGHLTTATPSRYAPDISGVSTTVLQIGGTLGIATAGTFYLSSAANPTGAFANTMLILSIVALAAAGAAWFATTQHVRRWSGRITVS